MNGTRSVRPWVIWTLAAFGAMCLVPAAAAQIVPAGTAAAPSKILFEDDVRSTRWSPVKDDTCDAAQDSAGYVVRGVSTDATCRLTLSFAGDFSGDLRIDTTVTLRQGSMDASFGLIFASNGDEFHKLAISGSGYYVLNYIRDSVWNNLVPWTESAAIKTGLGSTNRLSIEIRGDRLQAFINDKPLGSATTPRPTAGKIGFYVNDLNQEVVFSDVRVTNLAASATPVLTAGGRIVVDNDMATTQDFSVGRTADCQQAYADGGYALEGLQGGQGCIVLIFDAGNHPVYLRYEVSARPTAGGQNAYGLVFGAQPSENYVFAIDGNTYELAYASDPPRSLVVPTPSDTVRTTPGATNRLAVEINNRDVRLFLNGVFLRSVVAPTAPMGKVALGVVTPARVVFSNFKVIDFVQANPAQTAASGTRAVERTLLRQPGEASDVFNKAGRGGRQPTAGGSLPDAPKR